MRKPKKGIGHVRITGAKTAPKPQDLTENLETNNSQKRPIQPLNSDFPPNGPLSFAAFGTYAYNQWIQVGVSRMVIGGQYYWQAVWLMVLLYGWGKRSWVRREVDHLLFSRDFKFFRKYCHLRYKWVNCVPVERPSWSNSGRKRYKAYVVTPEGLRVLRWLEQEWEALAASPGPIYEHLRGIGAVQDHLRPWNDDEIQQNGGDL